MYTKHYAQIPGIIMPMFHRDAHVLQHLIMVPPATILLLQMMEYGLLALLLLLPENKQNSNK